MAKTLKEVLESFDFNRAALAKQRLANLRGSGRRVRGARIANLMRAAGIREEEMTDEDIMQIDEVLTKDAKAGDWIHDFVHSTNPKFEGKSKKERIKMALGAYYAKQRNEEVVVEAKPQKTADRYHINHPDRPATLASYKDKESAIKDRDAKYPGAKVHQVGPRGKVKAVFEESELDEGTYSADVERAFPNGKASGVKTHPVAPVPDKKYIKGTPEHKAHKAAQKPRTGHPTNEENELDEARYGGDAYQRDYASSISGFGKRPREDDEYHNEPKSTSRDVPHAVHINGRKWKTFGSQSHASNVAKKIKGATVHKEETEQIDEISKSTLGSYIKKASHDATINRSIASDFEHMAKSARKTSSKASSTELANKYKSKSWQRKAGVNKAVDRLTKEEKDTVTKDKEGNVTSWKHEGDWKKSDAKKNPEGKVHNLAGMALKKTKEMTKEELVGGQKNLDKNHNNKLDAQDFKILRAKKKVQENHEYEDGSMSIHELKQIKAHVDWILEMLKPETDMPEWVQAKITLAADYLSTACDYLHVEMNEEVKEPTGKLKNACWTGYTAVGMKDKNGRKVPNCVPVKEAQQYAGLEKEDKPGKIKTAVVKLHPKGVESETVEGWKDTKKPTKESYEEGNLITMTKTFQEFMTSLNEGKSQYMVKLSHANKGHTMYKTYTAEKGEDDYDIKRRATVDHSRHGYNVDSVRKKDIDTYEADDEGETSSTNQKRGRGRPAGAKSGARGPRIKSK